MRRLAFWPASGSGACADPTAVLPERTAGGPPEVKGGSQRPSDVHPSSVQAVHPLSLEFIHKEEEKERVVSERQGGMEKGLPDSPVRPVREGVVTS
jgi:hypothetical protein